ncbi:hypothetical protein Trydic_g11847 [Trypoxylus dichotomus]
MSPSRSVSMLCRLCLNKDELIYTFDGRLANGEQLRMCILLCTGVQILEEDRVSKMVCHKCCSLAVKLYQYRQTALANDKALKEIVNEPFREPPTNKDAILELHKSILENISQCKVSESVAQVYRVPLDDVTQVNNEDKVTKDDVISDENDETSRPHETVQKIFQYFPTAVVPREILDSNVLPSVPVDRDIKKYIRSEYEVIPADNSDGRVLKFKRKYPSTDVVKLSVKRPRNDDSNSLCSSDSESSIPSVFKSRKKQSNAISDTSCSDCDSDAPDADEKLPPPSPAPLVPSPPPIPAENKTNSRPSRSKASKNPLQFPDSDSDSEVTKKPPNTHYCEICDRTFWGWSQLKSHQRTHLKCIICRIICDSQEDLEYHQKSICFKLIEYNQPILVLPKVDENLFLLRIYKSAFDRYYQDIEDGVYGPPEPPPPPDPDYPYYHSEEHIEAETKFITTVFEKFKHLDNTPVVRRKVTQTRRAETRINYYGRNQIVIEDMFDDLNMYRIPVNVVVSPRVSAHLSFASQPKIKEPMDKWSGGNVKDIVVPQKDPIFFMRPKKPPPSIKPAATPKTVNKATKQEKHPKLLKALTATTAVATTSTTTAAVSTAVTSAEKAKSYNIAKLLSTTTISQNTVPKTVSLVNTVPQVRLPTRISSEVSLVAKPSSVPKSNANVYTNIMFRLPIATQNAAQQPTINQAPLQRYPLSRPPIQHTSHPPFPYIKEEPDIPPPPTPAEVAPTPPKILPPAPSSSYAAAMSYRLPTPPVHNQNEIYLKQEKDIEDNLYAHPQYNRPVNGPSMSYQNHVYRMPLSKPQTQIGYNQLYPTQPSRYRPTQERKNNAVSQQQYYNTNHHQNGMRYRSISGGSMMVLPNSSGGGQEGSLLSQIPPPPNMNPMPATHLLQTMNHSLGHHQLSGNLNHHSQQNHVNSMYMNTTKQPTIEKMSPISSVPSPLHSISSPVETKPLSSPITSMPPPLSNYNNNSYNTNSTTLYDHSYADTYSSSSSSYSDSYPSTYLPPQPQQYIPAYSPHSHMDIDPFVDQMLQQAAGSNNKLRVKQPWELNQV